MLTCEVVACVTVTVDTSATLWPPQQDQAPPPAAGIDLTLRSSFACPSIHLLSYLDVSTHEASGFIFPKKLQNDPCLCLCFGPGGLCSRYVCPLFFLLFSFSSTSWLCAREAPVLTMTSLWAALCCARTLRPPASQHSAKMLNTKNQQQQRHRRVSIWRLT